MAETTNGIIGDLLEAQRAFLEARNKLSERILARVAERARLRLRSRGTPQAIYDGHDVAQEVLTEFCDGLDKGRFEILNADSLWSILFTIVKHRCSDVYRYHFADKRPDSRGRVAFDIAKDTLTPEEVVESWDECFKQLRRLLTSTEDAEIGMLLERVAIDRLCGYSIKEIADRLGRHEKTIDRYLCRIRQVMSEEHQ